MPMFEYLCPVCGTSKEVIESAASVHKCTCGTSIPMGRVISGPCFHLKGSGWAKDNYSAT